MGRMFFGPNFFENVARLFRAIVTLSANILFTRILNTKSPRGPLFATWLLTFDCNAFCSFCSTHKLHKRSPEKISLPRAIELADQLADSGTWVVGFTGGEVFLSPLLKPLVAHLKKRGVLVYIITNGYLLEKNADWMVELGVDFVVISLDSHKKEVHDKVRKLEGLFDAALAGVAKLRKLDPQRHMKVVINAVLMKKNMETMAETVDYMNTFADDVRIQPITYGAINNPHGQSFERVEDYMFSPNEEAETRKSVKELFSKYPSFSKTYYRFLTDSWFNEDNLVEKFPCWSPFLRLLINPDGEVLQCSANSRFGGVGNVLENDIMEIWNSEELRRQRRIIGRKENNCTCWTMDTSFNALMKDVPLANHLPHIGGPKEPKEDAPIATQAAKEETHT